MRYKAPTQPIDFEAEVRRAYADYPYLRLKAIFIDVAQGAEKGTFGYFKSPDLPKEDVFRHISVAQLKQTVAEVRAGGSSIASMQNAGTLLDFGRNAQSNLFNAIVIQHATPFVDLTPKHLHQQLQINDIQHEIGHIVSPDARSGLLSKPQTEAIADTFSGIAHLRRFNNDPTLLQHLSWVRTYMALAHGDNEHLTSPAVDRLIYDSKSVDFRSTTLSQDLLRVKNYALDQGLTIEQAEGIHKALTRNGTDFLTNPNTLRLLAETALGSDSKWVFYVGARFYQPFLYPEGTLVYAHTNYAPQYPRQMMDRFRVRAEQHGFTDLAREFAECRNGNFPLAPKDAAGRNLPGPLRLTFG